MIGRQSSPRRALTSHWPGGGRAAAAGEAGPARRHQAAPLPGVRAAARHAHRPRRGQRRARSAVVCLEVATKFSRNFLNMLLLSAFTFGNLLICQ